ncbi:MAG: DUF362 domain-containing protein [Deltaproteobacteria bacterium]|nr:DUF362 domain-containing protein [Deltaproteobacteria bacterium]
MMSENTKKARVVIVKSSDVSRAVEDALNLVGGLERAVFDYPSILVKPNFCGGVPGERGSHTSVAVLESLLEILSAFKKKVFIGEADGSFNWADQVFSALNIHEVARRYGAQVVNLSKGPYLDLAVPQPLSLKTVRVSRLLTESAIINVAALKTHPWTGVTFSMKNMYGAVYEQEKAMLHAGLDKNIVDINKVIPPRLCLVDGIYAVKHGGFKYGVWVGYPPDKMDLIVAGYDPVATDVVCTRLLGRNPSQVSYIELAAAQNIGVNDPNKIEVKTKNYEYL